MKISITTTAIGPEVSVEGDIGDTPKEVAKGYREALKELSNNEGEESNG